jgi:hypothetical protein
LNGTDNINHIEKIVSIKTYDNFPDAAILMCNTSITVKKDCHYQMGEQPI